MKNIALDEGTVLRNTKFAESYDGELNQLSAQLLARGKNVDGWLYLQLNENDSKDALLLAFLKKLNCNV